MKSKKLLVMVLVLLAGSIAFAQYTEGVDFVQYTGNDYNTYRSLNDWNPWPVSNPHPKGWTESHIISLNVQKGSTVYLTSYVSNFNLDGNSHIANLGDDVKVNPLGYDMNANRYGYVIADKSENGNVLIDQYGNYSVKPGSEIHWGTGETIEVTYYDPDGTGAHQTTLGYKLGTFEENTEIFFVMRPNGYDGTMVTSYDLVPLA